MHKDTFILIFSGQLNIFYWDQVERAQLFIALEPQCG